MKRPNPSRRVLWVRCCQCGEEQRMVPQRDRRGFNTWFPPRGWIEVFVNPRAFPAGWQPPALMIRICPACAVPDQLGRVDALDRKKGVPPEAP